MVQVLHIIRDGGLDSFLAYELNQSPMNMSVITNILEEMGCVELPHKITVRNHYSDIKFTEYIYNINKGKYCQTNLDDESSLEPRRKKKKIINFGFLNLVPLSTYLRPPYSGGHK